MNYIGAVQPIFSASHSGGVSWTSETPYRTDQAKALSAQLVWTGGSFSGSFNIEVSNDGSTWSKSHFYKDGVIATEYDVSGTTKSPLLLTIPDYIAPRARLKFNAAIGSTGSLGTASSFYTR